MILRKATLLEYPNIWKILQQAIQQRKLEGSQQWQNGYPNEQIIFEDISKGSAFVLVENNEIIAYAAILFGIEPAYTEIKGKWLTNDNYVVIHRVAVANEWKGKGFASHLFKLIEDLTLHQKVYSIKVDTNFDNIPMLKILERLKFTYCGEVYFNGSARRAYEKVISKS